MYRVSLAKGKNYNLQVLDLHVEFSPSRPVKVFTDAEYNGSNDLAYYVGRGYLVATHFTESTVEEAPQAALKNDLVVTELKAKAKEEGEVIVADGASKTVATAKKQGPQVVKAESQTVKTEPKVTEKASGNAVKVEVKAPINEVKATVNVPKPETKVQANAVKTETKTSQAVKTDAQATTAKEAPSATGNAPKAETKAQVEPLKGTVVDNSSKQAAKSKK